MQTGHARQILAALRNGLIDLLRVHGWTHIAAAVRECAASVQQTLALIGAVSVQTLT